MIQKIKCGKDHYEVGKDNVKSIEKTNHGTKDRVIYKVTYEDGRYLFVGLLENHKIKETK